MKTAWELFKLFERYPITCFYGSNDFSRYKYMIGLVEILRGKESFVNKSIKDNVSVFLYPDKFGDEIFCYHNNDIRKTLKLEELIFSTGDRLYIPCSESCSTIYAFPIDNSEDQVQNVVENVFVASFPYAKEDFIEMVKEKVGDEDASFLCRNRVLMFDPGLAFAETDFVEQDDGGKILQQRLTKFVDQICSEIKEDCPSRLARQYYAKKSLVVERMKALFEKKFEDEFKHYMQKIVCDEGEKALMTKDEFMSKIVDFKVVKGSSNVEKTFLDNLINYIENNEKNICKLIETIYQSYLIDLRDIKENEIKECYSFFLNNVKKGYKIKSKEACPESSIEYRKMREKMSIRMQKYIQDSVERFLEKNIREQIKKILDKYEVECDEKIEN